MKFKTKQKKNQKKEKIKTKRERERVEERCRRKSVIKNGREAQLAGEYGRDNWGSLKPEMGKDFGGRKFFKKIRFLKTRSNENFAPRKSRITSFGLV